MVAKTKKTTLAREQLEDGLSLLSEGRYVSALTLLGAAEELMARLAEEAGEIHFLDYTWSSMNAWNRSQGGQDLAKVFVYRMFNEPRNSAKHHTLGAATSVTLFKVAAAAMMARRAISAADSLKLKFKNRELYESWVEKNAS